MRQVCQLCALDDFVSAVPLGPEAFQYTCTYSKKHPTGKPHTWEGTAEEPFKNSPESEGPAADLGMLEALPACIHEGEAWVEYGVVEHRYAKLNPDAFEELRQRYGHRVLGPTISPHHTASAYIARVLGMLRDRGVLAFYYAKATGEWSYNGSISYWAKPPPGPPHSQRLTYEAYRASAEEQ
jgi:hypothetical protein